MTTLDVPGIGDVDQKWVYAGGALVAGVAGYAWWRRSTSAPAVVPGVDTFPDAGTGGPAGYQNPAPTGTITPGGVGSAPTSDIEWSAKVTEVLGGLGYDLQSLAKVLGKYLTRQTLTPEEASWIQTAWAYVGRPPGGSYPILPAPPAPGGGTTPPPPPAPATWRGPVRRKVNFFVLKGAARNSWRGLVATYYTNLPPDQATLTRAGEALRSRQLPSLAKQASVPPGATVYLHPTLL